MITPKEVEYTTIAYLVKILGVMCAANPEKIVTLLTEYLFDEEESNQIKKIIRENNNGEG